MSVSCLIPERLWWIWWVWWIWWGGGGKLWYTVDVFLVCFLGCFLLLSHIENEIPWAWLLHTPLTSLHCGLHHTVFCNSCIFSPLFCAVVSGTCVWPFWVLFWLDTGRGGVSQNFSIDKFDEPSPPIRLPLRVVHDCVISGNKTKFQRGGAFQVDW